MKKPMTIILTGALIAVLGGLIGAFGTYLQNKKSSERNERMETGINKNVDLSQSTNLGVESLKTQNHNLQLQVSHLLENQDSLNKQLSPFIEYAKKKFPFQNSNEAFELLRTSVQQQILGTNIKLSALEHEVKETKKLAVPVKLQYDKVEVTKVSDYYLIKIFLKPSKFEQLGELDLTVTLANLNSTNKIMEIATDPEIGNYYILGPYFTNYSTNRIQAKLKYTIASPTQHPNLIIKLRQKEDMYLEGNYDLGKVYIKIT